MAQAASESAGRWQGPPPRSDARWRALPRELLLVVAGIAVYFGVRGLTETNPGQAVDNSLDVVQLESHLGIYVEPALQGVVTGSSAAMTAMNWVYIWGHWPVIAAVLLWLFLRHPDGYRQVRTTLVLSGGIGLVIFALFPVAPPRLAELGLVDTVTDFSSSYRVLQPPAFVNQYAAMPSLHVGWDLLMGYALFTWGRHRLLRAVGLVLPLLMAAAVVLTANHYLVDAVAGASLVVACLYLVRRHELWRAAMTPPPDAVTLPSQRTEGRRSPVARQLQRASVPRQQPDPESLDLRQHC